MADTGSSMSKRMCNISEKTTLHLAMLALQFGYAGFHIVSRLALNSGMSKLVFLVYRNVLCLLLLAPFAYFLEKKERPAMNISFLLQFLLLSIIGITANQGFYLLGLDNTSPTFASAIQNSVPALTFLMAVALRIEQVRLNRRDGIAKVLGTLSCVAGASVITLYEGPTIFGPSPIHQQLQQPLSLTSSVIAPELLTLGGGAKNWTLGCVFLIGHCLCWSGWLVLQAPVLKKYPARLSVTSYTCFFGVIEFIIIAAFIERDLKAWMFHSGSEVFSVFYAGFVASGIAFAVQIWCIDRGGPVFVAVYQPVQTLVVAIMASIALGEQFYLGGVIGAVLIIIGLYLVLWGKSEEKRFAAASVVIPSNMEQTINRTTTHSKSSSLVQPLLPSSTTENVQNYSVLLGSLYI